MFEHVEHSCLREIEHALGLLPPATVVKLYNSGSFFDPRAIPVDKPIPRAVPVQKPGASPGPTPVSPPTRIGCSALFTCTRR